MFTAIVFLQFIFQLFADTTLTTKFTLKDVPVQLEEQKPLLGNNKQMNEKMPLSAQRDEVIIY